MSSTLSLYYRQICVLKAWYDVEVSSPPPLADFLDYRAWLRGWFDAKKKANPRFSHRAFSQRVGQKSPSLLADVIAGRRNLTPQLTVAFAHAIGLDEEDTRLFEDLVELEQALTPQARDEAFTRIAAARRFREARRVEGDSYRYLSCWYIPAIRELARRPDFRGDPNWIAGVLCPAIRPDQAAQALEVLLGLGMLVQGPDGWVQAEGSVVTPREVAGLAVHNYHQGMLRLAAEAIPNHKAATRHFMAVTVCIPESAVPLLKAEINSMTQRILDLCERAPGRPERVYQVHLHAFPLSQPPDER